MNSRILRLALGAPALEEQNYLDMCVDDTPSAPSISSVTALAYLRLKFQSDEKLARHLQTGNADALTFLFARHSPLLFGIARRILRSDSEAEDVVQQIFLDVFRAIGQFDPEKASFKKWLLMFAYQRAFNRRRYLLTNRFFATESLDELPTERFVDELRSSPLMATESAILIRQVLRSLQPRQRQTIELIYYEGLTADEVSVRTGESIRVVRHNLYRGLERLRRIVIKGESIDRGSSTGGLR